jgi:hypothetical protein
MAEANRLQDVYCGEFMAGLTGNELLGNILKKARELGIPNPKVYSHSLGHFLHEPGPLIGLPWEQVNNVGRGDVKLVPMSAFTAEMSVTGPVPEWGGADGVPTFGMQDKDETMNNLLREMMFQMTWEFRPSRRRL